MDRKQLRTILVENFGPGCEWPGCNRPGEEMAHIEPRGMGGRPSVDTIDNVAWLCRLCHDVLDGRRTRGGTWVRAETIEHVLEMMMTARGRRNYLAEAIAPSRARIIG